jgi:ATP-dependent DNA ligase
VTGASPPRRLRRGDTSEPLPIALPVPPALPAAIRPEVALPCAAAFDHSGYRFAIDWDGARTLLFASEDGIRLQAETLGDVSDRFPEIVAAAGPLGRRRIVLDGVVTVLDTSGCPDLVALGERQAAGPALRSRLPTVFLAIDVLHLDGAAVLRQPLDRRLELLRSLELDSARIQVPDWVVGEGCALADAAAARRLPGLLARRGDAAYTSGVAGAHRLRIDLAGRTELCVVGAERLPSRRHRLLLGEHHGGHLETVAHGEIDETSPMWRWAAPGGRLRPGMVATALVGRRRADGHYGDVEVLTLRDDVDPGWCVRREPADPPSGRANRTGGFRPTVLTALPLGD